MKCIACRLILPALAIAAVAGTLALAEPPATTKPVTPTKATPPATPDAHAGHDHAMPALPPGMTAADMQACAEAATPGPMHEYLMKGAGVWSGKSKMWMAPGMEPSTTEMTSTISSMMDGRFVKCEVAGDMPGMGPFSGLGMYGYDNVSKKFQATWLDNCGTGMMTGTGELSSDQKTMTWTYNYTCPITKKLSVMREVQTRTGADAMTMEMYGPDPKTGKEFKMMEVAFTRKAGTAPKMTPSASVPSEK